MTLKTLIIQYKPHDGQDSFHTSHARFRILACGRRWGKTICGANEAVKQVANSPSESVGFCVAPTYWHTQKQWREFLRFCPPEIIKDINRAERRILLIGNRYVWFKSADNPDSLRSEGLDWLWVDEGGQMKEEAWDLALRPALMDKQGIAWFTGTPKGKNWYFKLWTRGQDKKQTDYQSWNFPSSNNPYLQQSEIDEFERDMTKLAFQQEILGMFIEDIGSVFRGVKNCISGNLEPHPQKGRHYVTGCDLGKHPDFTVICTMDDNGHLVGFDRFGELDWVFQRRRIVNVCRRYKSRLLIDSHGLGDPIYDELQRENVNVEGYKFTHASKKDLIENLSILIENQQISFPDIPVLINELDIFGYTTTKGGTRQYSAPEGYHDDTVIALALAAWQVRRAGPLDVGRGKYHGSN